MTALKRYLVHAQKAIEYVKDNLENTNALSDGVLAATDFQKGEFYTFLPLNVDAIKIDQLQYGGVGGKVRKQISALVTDELLLNPSLKCIFDNTKADYVPNYNQELFNICGRHYENEIYYAVTTDIVSPEFLDRCFRASNAIWHSLCVLTNSDSIGKIKGPITRQNIKDICSKMELLIVGAYDAEGYLFWKAI